MVDAPDDGGYRVIVTRAYAGVQEVRLYDDTKPHLEERNPSFTPQLLEDAIVETVTNPTAIHLSTTAPQNSLVFTSSRVSKAGHPMAVPVRQYASTTSYRVVSAGFRTRVNGDVVWKEGNEDE
jgi:hypothetical protein